MITTREMILTAYPALCKLATQNIILSELVKLAAMLDELEPIIGDESTTDCVVKSAPVRLSVNNDISISYADYKALDGLIEFSEEQNESYRSAG